MSMIDIVILVFVCIGAYSGFRKGLVLEIISLSAFFIAIIMGIKLMDWGIQLLDEYIEGYDTFLPFIVFIVIFIVIVLVMNLLGKAVKKVLDMTLLGSIDDLAGALLGVIKWALMLSIFFWLYESFGGGFSEETVSDSYLYDPVSNFAPGLLKLVSGVFPFIQEFFENSKDFVKNQDFKV